MIIAAGVRVKSKMAFLFSDNQHCVTVGIESVSLLDSVIVGGDDVIETCECGDQSEESGFGQMEIRYYCVGDYEFIAGLNE